MSRGENRPYWLKVLIAVGKALAYLGVFLGCQLLVGTIYSARLTTELMLANPTVGYYDLYDHVYDAYLAKTMEISLLSGLLTLAALFLFFKLRRRGLRQELMLQPVSGRLLGWCAGLGFGLYWLVTLVLSMLPEAWMEDYYAASEGLYQTGFIAFLATAIVAPVVEEIVFRGLILSRLERVMPAWVAVAVSAVIFGWCHGEAVWFCYAFALGMIFGYVTRSARSILPAILIHFVFNATNELMVLAGDWQPGVVGWLLILAVGTAGTAFCALRVRDALAAQREPPAENGGSAVMEERAPVEEAPCTTVHPARAAWDADSGPDHKFPPQMR